MPLAPLPSSLSPGGGRAVRRERPPRAGPGQRTRPSSGRSGRARPPGAAADPSRPLRLTPAAAQPAAGPGEAPRAGSSGAWPATLFALLALATADVLVASPPLRSVVWALAVLLAGGAALLTVVAAEHAQTRQARRWQTQAVAVALVMLAEMAHGTAARLSDPSRWLTDVGVALLLVATAASQLGGPRWGVRSLYLVLDATIVAVAVGLAAVVLAPRWSPAAPFSVVVLVAFAGAGYAVVAATRSALKAGLQNADAYLLLGVAFLAARAGGEAAGSLGLDLFTPAAAAGSSLLGVALLARSAWLGLRWSELARPSEAADDSRLRLAPALAAGLAILLLAGAEAAGSGTRAGFFGVIVLFGLISARLALALVENRQLLRRVERSGVFEVKLRDLGSALLGAPDQRQLLELVCRTAQIAIGADAVVLWMVDPSTQELEAAEVLGPRRRSVLSRRLPLDDPTSLAARVARTGEAEVVQHALSAGLSNQFLNVLLHAECLVAVPVTHGRRVDGVLVCTDGRNPTAYGAQELAKAELLASQVAVALDNAYQHDLQRRRLDEVTALYQFGQSAHAARSAVEVARQIVPILKERLQYTYASVWLRDPVTGTLRLAAGDSPGRVPLSGLRPSRLAAHAYSRSQPVRVGLGWGDTRPDLTPERSGVRSQLAVPMVLKDRVVGVVDLESRQPNAYSLNDERLLVSLANHSALVIDNLHLAEETRKVEALRELDRMKSELLSTVSHELRTPLASIKGYATTLLTHEHKLPREDRREFLEIID